MTGKAFVSAFGSAFVSAFVSAPAVLVFALVFALAVLAVPAGGPLFSQALSGDAPYMIPRNVYVGDQARLVVPLSSAFAPALAGGLGAAELGTAELERDVPGDDDLLILGLALEQRGSGLRLIIDFEAYRTGWVEFPPIVIGSQKITGLGAEISSLLEAGEEGRLLSPAAQALPVPGTVLMVYGFSGGALVCIIAFSLLSAGLVKNRDEAGRRFRRKKALRIMRKAIRRLKDEMARADFSPPLGGELLGKLSLALRRFLSDMLGVNCLSLVPSEFSGLDFERTGDGLYGDGLYIAENLDFLASFFSRSDSLRFGFGIDRSRVVSMVEEASAFITAFEKYRPPSSREETGGRP